VFHPAMRHAGGPRREIGIRTVFNILGPLTNPAGAQAQVLGVADSQIGEKMARALQALGTEHALVVHGEDGMDELSINSPTTVWELRNGEVRSYTTTSEDAGLTQASLDDIRGGTAEENAQTARNTLSGTTGPTTDVVLLNAAAALLVGGKAADLKQGVTLARQAIESGAATDKLKTFASLSQQLS